MLVDLGRNDLSRVCVPGTVQVERFLEPERFSHVTHLVSEVAGELRPASTTFDLLRATFPAGTVSGAPKVRAMQIISELEGYRRGPYAGAVALLAAGRPARRLHRDPHRRPARRPSAAAGGRRDRRRERPARRARGVPAQARGARGRDRAGGGWRDEVLLVDNYDSFTYNLAHLFGELGAEVIVRRNDEITPTRRSARAVAPRRLPRPGPSRGRRACRSRSCERLSRRVPTLGVCLGHQAIVQVFGGEVGQARELVHGKATTVHHDGRGHLRRPAGRLPGRALPLARGDVGAGRLRGVGAPRPTAR